MLPNHWPLGRQPVLPRSTSGLHLQTSFCHVTSGIFEHQQDTFWSAMAALCRRYLLRREKHNSWTLDVNFNLVTIQPWRWFSSWDGEATWRDPTRKSWFISCWTSYQRSEATNGGPSISWFHTRDAQLTTTNSSAPWLLTHHSAQDSCYLSPAAKHQ